MVDPSRRSAVAGLLGLGAAGLAPGWTAHAAAWPREIALGPAGPFSFEGLKAQAATLAARPYRAPAGPPANIVEAIDYDASGAIAYKPTASLWSDRAGDGSIRFFPLGRYARTPVEMNVVAEGQARAVRYSAGLFDMPAGSPARRLGHAGGFAGFRVMNADHATDWIAYLGAAYFRAADPFNQYGLSARGLAVDTAIAGPEEFPSFTAFWFEHEPAGLVVYALLDGPSVAGAYRIAHRRSTAGLVQEIEVQLNFRRPVERLGLAPLTSMYWYGASDRRPSDDWRPQIHDSDGLSIWTGAGERIWRPLANPRGVTVNAFQDRTPRGFGLMQRDRRFEDYQDDGVFYERRPSAWVEPLGDWGAGSVQLVELPTTGETEDNIVAFWTPAARPAAGQRLAYSYRLHWACAEPGELGVARVAATWQGRAGRPGEASPPGRRKFVVDFTGAGLAGLTRRSGVTGVVDARPSEVLAVAAYPIEGRGCWRLMFDVEAPAGRTVDLRAFLKLGDRALTETWIDQVVGV
jgi:periplasmic glucans biosynthesis protein